MPTPTKGPRLGGSPAHERIILGNLASQLFEHGRITTTEAKAKRVQPLAEKLITKAKRGDLHARRQVYATVTDRGVVEKLFTEIAPTFADRDGGYTRITKIGNRKGDNAPLAVIELVTETVEEGRKKNPRRTTVAAAPETPAEVPAADAPVVAPGEDEATGEVTTAEETTPQEVAEATETTTEATTEADKPQA